MHITLGEKAAMREIHVHGQLDPAWDTPSCFGAAGVAEDDDQFTTGGRTTTRNRGIAYAPRRCASGFEVVRTDKMVVMSGPFKSLSEADEAASILRMERRAERTDSIAIKKMAARAYGEDEYDS